MSDDEEIQVNKAHRVRAHEALDHWLDQSNREGGSVFDRGRSGHLGEFKVTAYVDDDGVTLTVERTFSEQL